MNKRILGGAGVVVLVVAAGAAGYFLRGAVPPQAPPTGSSAETTPAAHPAPGNQDSTRFEEASALYDKANQLYENGQFEDALKEANVLKSNYGDIRIEEALVPESFADIASRLMNRSKCQIERKTKPEFQTARTAEQTANLIVDALNKNNQEALIKLIDCDVWDGIAESEFDPTLPEKLAAKMAGETASWGTVKVVAKTTFSGSEHYMIGKDPLHVIALNMVPVKFGAGQMVVARAIFGGSVEKFTDPQE